MSDVALALSLDYLLVESMLDKLLAWSASVGEFTHTLRLKQLHLYTLLVEQLCHRTALFTRPLVRPMFHLLAACSDAAPVDVERRFVALLNSLSRCLLHNTDLLDLFFVSEHQQTGSSSSRRAQPEHRKPWPTPLKLIGCCFDRLTRRVVLFLSRLRAVTTEQQHGGSRIVGLRTHGPGPPAPTGTGEG